MNIKIALQLYTLKQYCQDIDSLRTTLAKVKQIGYNAVQIDNIGVTDPNNIIKAVREADLTICATHENPADFYDTPMQVIERLKTLECNHTAIPKAGTFKLTSTKEILEYCKKLNTIGKLFYDNGITLSYHNHDAEFSLHDGKRTIDIILDNTDSKYLKLELDTFWVHAGGCNIVDYIKKVEGRMPLIHLKDWIVTPERERQFGEVGYGNLDWNRIIPAAYYAGCEWYIVEQDKTQRDPFESVEMSYNFLKKY